ncbi:polyprenol monophosphomannose synthase [Bacteriovoracaceae bacterium]|nr:polyprenol monophosphomannose synthase [Bacteriovoracaceae bacterium]
MNELNLPYKQSLLIIPTYNEIDNIERMLNTLLGLYPELNILIIDDGSPDGTADIVKGFQEKNANINLIQREGKLGLGTAYITGFRFALSKGFDYIFEMDCDFSHDPKDIPNLLSAAISHDLAIGSRYIGGIRIINWPMHRLLLSFFASWYTRIITSLPLTDATGGFKCFSRKALESIDLDKIFSNGYSFQIELNYKVWKKGLKIKEVPIVFTERRDGHSKMNRKIVYEAIFAVFRLRLFA